MGVVVHFTSNRVDVGGDNVVGVLAVLDEVAAANGVMIDFATEAGFARPDGVGEISAHEGVVTPVETAKEEGEKAVEAEVTKPIMVRATEVVTEFERNDNATSRGARVRAEEETIRGQAVEGCLLVELRSRGESII
jgi:hypothetical protein